MQDTSNEPPTQTLPFPIGRGQQIVNEWKSWCAAYGPEDVALLEGLLDDALTHLSKVLSPLPNHNRKVTSVRTFLAQFRQP